MVLLNGPVHNAWFCLMDRYRNVCVWFMARNCRFPKVGTWEPQVTIARNCRFPEDGTLGSQPGNQRLPLQANAGSQRLYTFFLTLKVWRSSYWMWNSRFPTWEPQVTIARNCRFPEVGTLGSQPGNHGLPLQATLK